MGTSLLRALTNEPLDTTVRDSAAAEMHAGTARPCPELGRRRHVIEGEKSPLGLWASLPSFVSTAPQGEIQVETQTLIASVHLK